MAEGDCLERRMKKVVLKKAARAAQRGSKVPDVPEGEYDDVGSVLDKNVTLRTPRRSKRR